MKIMKKAVSLLLSVVMVLTMFTVLPAAVSALTTSARYIDADGDEKTVEATYLSSVITSINPGWYYVPADTSFSDPLELKLSEQDDSSEFNIIIADSETLTFANSISGIYSEDAVTLNVYFQEKGTGKIKSKSGGNIINLINEDASFNLYGGTVSAPDPYDDFIVYTQIYCVGDINLNGSVLNTSIYSGSDLTINKGIVNVPDIYAENSITVNGGNIEATDSDTSAIISETITLNLTDEVSSIRSTGYEGKVEIKSYLTDGTNIYYIDGDIDNAALANKTLRHAGHVHDFDTPEWVWNGYTSATATFICRECHEVYTYTAEGDAITQKVVTEPTETSHGRTDYTATLTVYGKTYTNTKPRTTHVGNHQFGDPVWEWDGYEAATLTLTCTVDDEVVVTEAAVTHETTLEPTMTAVGERVHTAKATVQGTEYTDKLHEVLPKLDRTVEVAYRNLNGSDVTVSAARILGDETELDTGWYAVTENVTIDRRPNCKGNVNLILCDGKTFTANKGINVADGATLTIWAQSAGTGTIDAGCLPDPDCTGIGTSYAMNSDGDMVRININGGIYQLDPVYGVPGIGCAADHCGVITVNNGTIEPCENDAPVVGFWGEIDSVNERTHIVNIKGGEITLGEIEGSVGIGCVYGKTSVVNISGGTINATSCIKSAAIGSYEVEDSEINITGGNINVKGIGNYISNQSKYHCTISLNWRSLNSTSVYSDDYFGTVVLYKAFKDKDNADTIFNAGTYEAGNIGGFRRRTLVPYCNHSKHTAPVWSWNTEGEVTATAEYRCADCFDDYHKIDAPVTAEDHLFERHYTASVTIDGIVYTDRCETAFDRAMDIFVGGVYITKDNCGDVLGDGTVSYDVDTNTLTLDRAEFYMERVSGSNAVYGIRYGENSDKPFRIVLKGGNIIKGYIGPENYNRYSVLIKATTPECIISGSGSLNLDNNRTGSSNQINTAIDTQVPLTLDGCSLSFSSVDGKNLKSIDLENAGTVLTLKNNARVWAYLSGSSGYTISADTNEKNIDIEKGSVLDLYTKNVLFNDNVNLTDRTKALGVAVTNADSRDAYSWWDGTTPLSSYKGVVIPKDNAKYTVKVISSAQGTATADVSSAQKGDIITIDPRPLSDNGYRFAYLTITEDNGTVYDVYDNKFTMPADNVTVKAHFYTYADRVEPYIDENGEYILGTVEHFIVYGPSDKYYSVRSNGCMGDQIADLSLSYFMFNDVDDSDLEIYRYTGPTANLTKLEVPKTYQGKKITKLYFGDLLGRISTPYEVVLTENVTTIKSGAFRYTRIAKVSGDTSGLKEIGSEAFSYNRTGGNKLDIRLDYPGEIKCSAFAFEYTNVTAHLKHDTTLSGNHSARSLTYDFTDEHRCDGNITWSWNGDYTAARATYTCADSRCREQATVDADISSKVVGSNCEITATVVIGGETYTDTVTVPLSQARYVDQVEPYIDDDGAYIPGVKEHYVLGDKYFAVNSDGSVGSEMRESDITLSYFNFEDNDDGTLKITRYTGEVTSGMDLVIPKTYGGKAITVLGDGERRLFNKSNTFNVILTENITTINTKCFSGLKVLSVEGDTSNLSIIRDEAFADDSKQLHLYLDHEGVISNGGDSFKNTTVVFHMKHAAHFIVGHNNATVTYDFTDDHIYPDTPTWEWEDDCSSAKAVLTCTDSRCKHRETHEATVTADKAVDKTTYTATVTINGTTYTDVKVVEKTAHSVTINEAQNGSVSADKTTAYEGEEITLTITPDDDYQLEALTVKDANNKDIPVSGLSFTMPDSNVTVTAIFKQTKFTITYSETSGGWVRGVYSADSGETVSLELIPASGYELDTLTVRDSDDHEITVTNDTFTMPESNVTVTATFKKYDLNITYEVTVGRGTVSGAGKAKFNDEVPLTVIPDEGYILFNLYAKTEEWDDPVSIIDGNLIMADDNVTVYAEFVPYTAMKEPYIDENGAYILGNIAYAEVDGTYFEVKDGVVGESVESVELSYFDFALINDDTEYRINYYTGPTDDLSRLVIPKTFNGKKITVLGSSGNDGFYSGKKTQFELVLNENIREIAPYTFYVYYVTKVSGDTSGLSKLGGYAFSWANSPGGYSLDITLTYPGKITTNKSTFNHMKVTVYLPHGTSLSTTGWEQSMTYVFTDAHTYGEPKWTWTDDHSAATATFTCTDSRCKHEEIVNATVAAAHTADGHVYTATVEFGGETYTDTVTEDHAYGDPVWNWSDDYSTATATFICADDDCDHAVTVNADIEGGGASEPIIYTATVIFGGVTYSDKQEVYTDGFGAELYGYTLSLDGDIGVNFYMSLSDKIAHSDTAYMHFTIPKNGEPDTQLVYVRDAEVEIIDGRVYYVFKCRVAAKEMNSQIKAQMKDNGGEGKVYTYTVKQYADYLLSHTGSNAEYAKAAPLVRAMLNYGARAQIFFDKTSAGLANAGLSEADQELGEVTIFEPATAFSLPEGVTFEGASVSLKSETSLSLYFKSSSTLTFAVDGKTVETVTSGGYQIARIRGISAKELSHSFTLTVAAGGANGSVTYSPMNYCYNVLYGDTEDAKLRNVVKALCLYSQAAETFFQ